MNGLHWPEPVEVLADLWDLTIAANWSVQNKDAPTYRRPWVKQEAISGTAMDAETYAAWRARQFQQPEGGDPDGG